MEHQAPTRVGDKGAPVQVQGVRLQRTCACGQHTVAGGECTACREQHEPRLGRAAAGAATPTPGAAPPIVHEVLRAPGQPLDREARAFMEPRFGYDFSRVRVHTGTRAAESARAVEALAYTVGSDIVFGAGQYTPGTPAGRKLIGHELAHVVQQGSEQALQAHLVVDPDNSPAEHEAEAAAERVAAGDPTSVSQAAPGVVQRQACKSLLDATERKRVNGIAAHTAITADYVGTVGDKAVRFNIPAAAFSPYRTEGCGDAGPSEINPVIYGGSARQGQGIPDLMYQDGRNVEIAEIKAATYGCLVDAELQVANYVEKGNREESRRLKRDRGIDRFGLMPTGRFTPTSPVMVGDEPVTVAWCNDGVIGYKAIRDQDPEIIICNLISDKGYVDRFLDRVLGRAQGLVDKYVNEVIDPVITRAIQTLTVRQAVELAYRSARDEIKRLLAAQLGPGGELIVDALPDETIINLIAEFLDSKVRGEFERQLRAILQELKKRFLEKVRQEMQARIRQALQEALAALCAGAVTLTAAMLLKRLSEMMQKLFQDAAKEVLVGVVLEMLKEFAKGVLAALAVALAVIAFIVLLPEELAAAIGAAIAAALRAAVAALIRLLPELLPQLAGGLAAAARALAPQFAGGLAAAGPGPPAAPAGGGEAAPAGEGVLV